jgi:hypothetical protein
VTARLPSSITNLIAGADVPQKQLAAGWTLNEVCGLMGPLAKLVKARKLDCALAVDDVMNMFVETLLASGEIFKSDSQHISTMFKAFTSMSFRPSPIFMSAITRLYCVDVCCRRQTAKTDALA